MALVLRKQADPQLLDTYEQERYPHVAAMIRFSSFLGRTIMPTSKLVAMLRDSVLRTLNTIPFTRTIFTEASIKPAPRYKRGAIVRHNLRTGKALTGLLLPQPIVITTEGQHMLLDDILGPGFAIVCCHPDPVKVFADLNTQFWQQLGTHFVCLQPTEKKGKEYALNNVSIIPRIPLHVVQTNDTHFLRMCRDMFIVVRPDRYVVGIFKEKDMSKFTTTFQTMLHGKT